MPVERSRARQPTRLLAARRRARPVSLLHYVPYGSSYSGYWRLPVVARSPPGSETALAAVVCSPPRTRVPRPGRGYGLDLEGAARRPPPRPGAALAFTLHRPSYNMPHRRVALNVYRIIYAYFKLPNVLHDAHVTDTRDGAN